MTNITPEGIIISCSLASPKGSPSNPTKEEYYLHVAFFDGTFDTPPGKRFKDDLVAYARAHGGPDVLAKAKRGEFRFPLRSVDPTKAAAKGWGNVTFDMNLKSGKDFRPKVVDVNLDPVLDVASEAYPGRHVRASTEFFKYSAGKSPIPGIGVGLSNVQLLGHGERLAGSRGDGSEFGGPGGLASNDDDLSELM